MVDFFVGLVIISCCIGSLYGTVYGWLVFGVVIFLSGIISMAKELAEE